MRWLAAIIAVCRGALCGAVAAVRDLEVRR